MKLEFPFSRAESYISEQPMDDGHFGEAVGRDRRRAITAAIVFFLLFAGLAWFVPMDAAGVARGHIGIEGSRQQVQHREGGVVDALLTSEGQSVKPGQPLLRLRVEDRDVTFHILRAQVYDLIATRARLIAESEGRTVIPAPYELQGLTGEDRAAMTEALARQSIQLHARSQLLASRRRALSEQVRVLNSRTGSVRDQMAANADQYRLLDEELAGMREIAKKGFASINRVRALERSQAGMREEAAQLRSSAEAMRGQAGQASIDSQTLLAENNERVLNELRQTETALAESAPRLALARQRLEETIVRAPIAGLVMNLAVHRSGVVIGRGQTLLEIVPTGAPLVIEARVPAGDSDGIHIGQDVEVRVMGRNDRAMPMLRGDVTTMSPDSLVDRQTGGAYYPIQVHLNGAGISRDSFEAVRRSLRPGLPVEVILPLRRRTLVQYLIEPLQHALSGTFRER